MEDIKVWATLVGAIVAGVTGLVNLIIQLRGKRDSFTVAPYSSSHDPDQRAFMHVINLSDHPIKLVDWGWVDSDKCLRSIRSEAIDPGFADRNSYTINSPQLEARNDIFEVGYLRTKEPIGAFARSATQRRPTISFTYNVSVFTKLKVRIRVWWLGSTYLH